MRLARTGSFRDTGDVEVPRKHPWLRPALITAGIILLAACIELAMGRVLISKSGRILLWVGSVNSAENSQQLSDWYSLSHILHGFILYGLLRLVGRGRWGTGMCVVMAICVEASWEVVENTSFVINRYREETISLDYYGDSVLNSMSDMLFCLAGFALAAWLPVWSTVTLAVVIELVMLYVIRDNLTLNIIMLLHPFEAIKHWQAALPK